MPAGRKAQPITQIVIKLTRNDLPLINFCEYYKSQCGRKAGEKKLRGEGVLDKDIDGDYAKFLKDELLYAVQKGTLGDSFVDLAKNAIAWAKGKGGSDKVAEQIIKLSKSDAEVKEMIEKLRAKGVMV